MANHSTFGCSALRVNAVIRPMDINDIPRINQIEQQVTPHPWRENQFVDSHTKHSCLSLILNGQVIGYAIYHVVVDEAEILNIAIAPDYQGKGYGRELLDDLVNTLTKRAKRLFLEVRASNDTAIQLYDSAGFVEICLRTNYYQTKNGPEDAIMMAMEL